MSKRFWVGSKPSISASTPMVRSPPGLGVSCVVLVAAPGAVVGDVVCGLLLPHAAASTASTATAAPTRSRPNRADGCCNVVTRPPCVHGGGAGVAHSSHIRARCDVDHTAGGSVIAGSAALVAPSPVEPAGAEV